MEKRIQVSNEIGLIVDEAKTEYMIMSREIRRINRTYFAMNKMLSSRMFSWKTKKL